MKYILNELFDPYRFIFYGVFGFALSFGPWVTMNHFWSTVSTILGAYLVLIVWIVLRTIWLTIRNKMRKDG